MILENFTNFLDLCIKEATSRQRFAHSDLQFQEASAAEETFKIMKSVAEDLKKKGITEI
jgi:hypothetical protein